MLQQLEFKRHKVQQVLRTVLEERMKGQMYDPVKGAQVRPPCFCGGALLCMCRQAQLRVALPAQMQASSQHHHVYSCDLGLSMVAGCSAVAHKPSPVLPPACIC